MGLGLPDREDEVEYEHARAYANSEEAEHKRAAASEREDNQADAIKKRIMHNTQIQMQLATKLKLVCRWACT